MLTDADAVRALYGEYLAAGADVIRTTRSSSIDASTSTSSATSPTCGTSAPLAWSTAPPS